MIECDCNGSHLVRFACAAGIWAVGCIDVDDARKKKAQLREKELLTQVALGEDCELLHYMPREGTEKQARLSKFLKVS